jgi:tRNA pseudouridine38/39 synthase
VLATNAVAMLLPMFVGGLTNVSYVCSFSTQSREYKYFIVQDGGLDLLAMQQAADYLVGEHDFRHFCKVNMESARSWQ